MDAMKKLDKEYLESLKAKKDSIVLIAQSFLNALKTSAKENIDPGLLSSMLEKFQASTNAYGFFELSKLTKKYRELLIAKEYSKNKTKFLNDTKEWLGKFHSQIEKLTAKTKSKVSKKRAA